MVYDMSGTVRPPVETTTEILTDKIKSATFMVKKGGTYGDKKYVLMEMESGKTLRPEISTQHITRYRAGDIIEYSANADYGKLSAEEIAWPTPSQIRNKTLDETVFIEERDVLKGEIFITESSCSSMGFEDTSDIEQNYNARIEGLFEKLISEGYDKREKFTISTESDFIKHIDYLITPFVKDGAIKVLVENYSTHFADRATGVTTSKLYRLEEGIDAGEYDQNLDTYLVPTSFEPSLRDKLGLTETPELEVFDPVSTVVGCLARRQGPIPSYNTSISDFFRWAYRALFKRN